MSNKTFLKSGVWVLLFCFSSISSCIDQKKKDYNLSESVFSKPDTLQDKTTFQNDTALYHARMHQLANGDSSGRWPPDAAYPMEGSLLPFNRIVAFYGNFYSKKMGILGELPVEQMLHQLNEEILKWTMADTLSPVIPAIHYIAVTAQRNPGQGGKFRLRMPFAQIEKAIALAKAVNGIVILDIQVGLSTLQQELPVLDPYLILPQVHLGIDPEYSMKDGSLPGTSIGSFDASDINYASAYLAQIIAKNNLPPKLLVVHRFTTGMVTGYDKIVTRPEVQLIINMDGFGFPGLKKSTYSNSIFKEPVQFAGFKLFYKNDTLNGNRLMKPEEILMLRPQPVYIQYQ